MATAEHDAIQGAPTLRLHSAGAGPVASTCVRLTGPHRVEYWPPDVWEATPPARRPKSAWPADDGEGYFAFVALPG